MIPKFDFSEWIKKEMTSTASTGAGGSYTDSIAGFARPLTSEPIRRGNKKHKKKKKKD